MSGGVGVSIGIGLRTSDLAQSREGFERLGLSAADAGAEVAKLATAAREGGGKIEAATISAVAAMGRLGTAAETNTGRAQKAAEAAAFKIEDLRRKIDEARAAGAPVSPDAVATLAKLEAGLDANVRKIASYKNAQDDVRDAVLKSRTESDLQRGSINDLGDLVERMGPKWADMVGKISAGVGTFAAAYAGTRKLIEGLKELTGIDVDSWVQGKLSGIADWIVGADDAAGAADRLRNAQHVLRERGIDPTGKSLEELDRLLEANAKKSSDAAVAYEEGAKKRAKAAKEAAEAEAETWRQATRVAEEAARRQVAAREASVAWARDFVAGLDPATAALSRFASGIEKLDQAALGGLSAEDLGRAVDGLEKQLADALKRSLAAVNDTPVVVTPTLDKAELEALLAKIRAARGEGLEVAQAVESWAPAIAMAGEAIAQFNAGLGEGIIRAAQLAANVASAYQAWKASGSKQGYTGEGIAGGMAIGSQVGSTGQSFGWWSGDRGSSGFGGARSGDYGDTGALIVGAIGSFFGPVGSLIGGLIGGVLGGMIKKGADEGLATLRQTVVGVAMMVGKNEGGLGDQLALVGKALDASLRGVLEQIGAQLVSIPETSFKIRDDVVAVFVNGVKSEFKDLQSATEFALSEILTKGELSGVGPAMAQALKAGIGKSMEDLASSLDFAQWVDNLGLDEVAVSIREQLRAFASAMAEAAEQGIGADGIVANLGRSLAAIRNQVLGISETEEERITRQAAAFNAEVGLLKAQEAAKQADLLMQRADLAARYEILRAEAGITEGSLEVVRAQGDVRRAGLGIDAEWLQQEMQILDGEAALLEARGQVVVGQGGLLAATLYQLRAVDEALAAVGAVMDNLPDLISADEIAAAIRGVSVPSYSPPSGASSPAGPTPEELAAERERRAAAARDEALGLISSVADAGLAEKLRAMLTAAAKLRAEYTDLGLTLEEATAAEEARRQLLREEAVGALGLASDAIRKRYDAISRTLGFLSDNLDDLKLSEAELARIRGELGAQLYGGVARQIAEAIGDQETLAALQELEWQLKLAQWELEIQRIEALNLLTEEQEANLRRLLGLARDFDPTTGTAGTGGSSGGSGFDYWAWYAEQQSAAADMMAEQARRLAEAIDRLVDFQRSLFLDDQLSPLTGVQRLGLAETAAQQAVAALAAMGPNDTRRADAMSALPDILRSYLQELASVYGTAAPQYAEGFAWVAQVLSALTGQTVMPFPVPGSGSGGGSGISQLPGGGISDPGNPRGPHIANILPFASGAARLGTATTGAQREGAAGVEARIDRSNVLLERLARSFEELSAREREAGNAERRKFAGVTR
ncbi:MAG: hypothetical protein IPQ07_39985 [Myxococcales bacterium]|nr:hypothetical protein [Myxococcales bacterium]